MDEKRLLELMEHHGVKPTANRIVIARALAAAGCPMSMTELETVVETIDKSNIFRTLQAFREAHLVHVLDDSGDGVRYELCHSHHDDEDDDVHVHFYCEKCHRTFCLEDTPVPPVHPRPSGFHPGRLRTPDCQLSLKRYLPGLSVVTSPNRRCATPPTAPFRVCGPLPLMWPRVATGLGMSTTDSPMYRYVE